MTETDPSTPDALEHYLLTALAGLDSGVASVNSDGPDADMRASELRAMFTAQCLSRHTDLLARRLRLTGRGYYSIGSAGHESNAAVAIAARPTDPALLHYRSGAFYIARSVRAGASTDPVDDIVAGLLAHTDEPIAGGRHKVFGHPDTAVIPQTSTIASHLPRAVGIAMAIGRARKIGAALRWPLDAVTICSFGDASANHSTALGAINAACHLAYQHLPVPLVLVCEDNGLGISVRTPAGWIEESFAHRPGLHYLSADGADADSALTVAHDAIDHARRTRQPVFLHLRTVRFLAHAGTDVERGYRSVDEIRAGFALDPILGTARALRASGLTGAAAIDEYRRCAAHVESVAARRLVAGRELSSAGEVMASIAPRPEVVVATPPVEPLPGATPHSSHGAGSTLANAINAALAAILDAHRDSLLFGEDIAVKGGVYGVTKGLRSRFGAARVFDTLLDEQSILGVALGAAVSGMLPIAEIEYLAYLHNAEDQLRGEAATLQFFSQGAYRNGMIVRIAGYGYQKGFGGHFHNDDSIAVLRDIPGIVIASPARPSDAASMLLALAASARADGTVGVVVEPIALYHQTDLHREGDRLWLDELDGVLGDDAPGARAGSIGTIRRYGDADPDVTIVTWGNGLWMSMRVARRLAVAEDPVRCQVIDLHWIAPLPIEAVLVCEPRRVLVVDETRRTGGVSESVIAGLVDRRFPGPIARVTSKDSFVPLGDAARLVLLGEDEIERGVRDLAMRDVAEGRR